MKKHSFLPVLLFISMFLLTGVDWNTPSSGRTIILTLTQGQHELHFNPKTGSLEYYDGHGYSEFLSDSAFSFAGYQVENRCDSSLTIRYSELGLTCQVTFTRDLVAGIKFKSTRPQTLSWPRVSISKAGQFLIWPQNEGYYIPFCDSLFARKFDGRTVNASTLSLPFWAVMKDPLTVMYEMTSPFHNETLFADRGNTMDLMLQHRYTPNEALAEPYEIRIIHLSDRSPIGPALYFRSELERMDDLVKLTQKMESVPLIGRMIGAPQGRLISGPFISKYDVVNGNFIGLAKAIRNDIQDHRGYVNNNWRKLEPDQKDMINQVANSERLNNYQEVSFIRALGAFLSDEGVNDEFAKHRRENARQFYEAYSEYLLPPEEWGTGVSLRMINALKDAGIDRMILQATGYQITYDRKEVVKHAFDLGYLFGIYDSYHSIHEPSAFGTDDSWETAQMKGVSYDSVRMRREDGSAYPGFRSTGGLANPKAVRNFFEKRISEKFEEVPFSYYFIDCDSYGEYYDDYAENHPMTQEEDASQRMDRLKWLRSSFRVPVGSEKGTWLFSNILDINEGVTVPVFGFRDKDMHTNQDSPYFLGHYWPPEMMEIAFKEVSIKAEYQHLYFDPRFKIPLWETVYHDCLISVAHPASPGLKFSEVKTDVALTEMFYQYPPVYNLNFDFFRKNKDRIVHEYQFYSLTHPKTVYFSVTGFEFLTPDRLVQHIQFGRFQLVANYSQDPYRYLDVNIPGKSVVFIDENGDCNYFDPENF